MKRRAKPINEAAVAELKAGISKYRTSLIVIGAVNICLLMINFLFLGYFYAKQDQGREFTADFRIDKVRDDLASAAKQLGAVDQEFASAERNQRVSDTLEDAASLFNILADEEKQLADLTALYLLRLQSLTDETSEWAYLQGERLTPLVDRVNARAKMFSEAAEQMQIGTAIAKRNDAK